MTAEEIRNKKNWECYGQPYDNPIQSEIAAQLAEANELKRIENAADDMLAVLKAAIAFIGQTQEYKTGHTGAGSIVTRGNAAIAKAGGQ